MKVIVKYPSVHRGGDHPNFICCIKFHRFISGLGLRDSKEFIESDKIIQPVVIDTFKSMAEIQNEIRSYKGVDIKVSRFKYTPVKGTFETDGYGDCILTIEKGKNHLHLEVELDKVPESIRFFSEITKDKNE